ncbi:FAD binding domain protein [Colletotrichum tofieldiae]|uniref:FAD binding domain protein (FAD dependent oxidoreductase) n=1 Tax=Colletotrichum tofieldiae TaxID=708197 RepID=A0A166NL38_9PEZI|nr:FAD binding domain protein (FAD dependent oxidoreductase) [Colletotrichum tofieldiae]GKT58975.1 FAD binding domain protein [Colletotrichum tofieldiae]GKT77602.1 FAD binding domain protein [Colletotrichum tofieldiae]
MSEEAGPNASDPLHVIIIGAGLAGLATALSTKLANPSHRVTILEAVKELQEVGAGLQLTPNATRLLGAWGLDPTLSPLATRPSTLSVHRYDGTRLLAHEPQLQESIQSRYGYPFWGLHRVELQRALVDRCTALGVETRLSSRVRSVDFARAVVTLDHDDTDAAPASVPGSTVAGDVVVCADGMWSATRAQFLNRPSPPALTGDLAFRIAIPIDSLKGPHKAELEAFIQSETVHFWVGPQSHGVSYTVKQGRMLNLGLLSPDNLPEGSTKVLGDVEEMRSLFSNWDPLLRKLLDQVESVHKWKLCWIEPLDEWASADGSFFMAGDCCHPMLPYLAQGANSSLEDGAVLGYLLGKVGGRGTKAAQLPAAAAMYQRLRMGRGQRIVMESFRQRDDFHLPDGPEQERRDEVMTASLRPGGAPQPGFPSRWTCPEIQGFLYSYDAYAEAARAYDQDPY